MTKPTLAAVALMFTAASGHALAYSTVAPGAPRQVAVARLEQFNASNALDQVMATGANGPDAYRYHGGPKTND